MTFIPSPGKKNYTQTKTYCPIILLYIMHITMQKVVTRNIRDETFGHVPYIYNNLSTNQVIPQKPQWAIWLHLYSKQWKTASCTWDFLDIEVATVSSLCDIKSCQVVWAWGDILVIGWLHVGWQKNYRHTHRRNTGGVCGQVLSESEHFITP